MSGCFSYIHNSTGYQKLRAWSQWNSWRMKNSPSEVSFIINIFLWSVNHDESFIAVISISKGKKFRRTIKAQENPEKQQWLETIPMFILHYCVRFLVLFSLSILRPNSCTKTMFLNLQVVWVLQLQALLWNVNLSTDHQTLKSWAFNKTIWDIKKNKMFH